MKKHHNTTKMAGKRRLPLLGLAATIAVMGAMPAAAFVSTSDSVTRANTANAAQAAQNTNVQMAITTQAVTETNQAIGPAGSVPSPIGGALGTAVGTGSEFYQSMQDFGYDMCAVTLCRGNDPIGTKDIEEARTWAMKNFYTQGDGRGGTLSPEARRDLLEIRRRNVAYAAANGLALSVTVHNDLAGADGTANALESKISESPHMRADIQANSAVLLAQYKVQLQQLAVLTAQLDVMAAGSIAATDIYHEDGGSRYADAFIDSDFKNNYADRASVTRPSRGSGSLGLNR